MNLNISKEWLLEMAENEGDGFVSVGGLVSHFAPELTPANAVEWSRLFPVNLMRKYKFSLPTTVSDVAALLEFFDISTPNEWQAKWDAYPVAFRQTQVFEMHFEAIAAWIREAEIIASQIPLADFNETKLRALLDDLRRLTRLDVQDGLSQVQAICAAVGVAVVLVPELPGTRISGCARWLSNKTAMIGMTLRYKTNDQLWFTFFHELGHILLHQGKQSFVVDNAVEHIGDDIVDSDMAKYEEEADRFAANTLISPDDLDKFLHLCNEMPTSDEVQDFAESIGIAPGIVVGRLQHDGILQRWQGNKLKQTLTLNFIDEE